MRMRHTYIFCISILFSCFIYGQENTKVNATDTLPPSEKYGLRVGVDLARFVRTAVNDDYSGFEVVADYRIYKKFFIAAELGNESLLRKEPNINVEGSGSYIRLGFDYNAYQNWYGMQNSIYAGLRYGFSTFDQTLNSYRVFTSNNYFPTNEITESKKSTDLTAGWVELVFGLKVELIKNLYLGASVSIRNMTNEKKPDGFDNLFIPGFGRNNDFSEFGIGYNYSISYLIPFYKKKR